MASPRVGSPITACQLSTGNCEVTIVERNPCRSSIAGKAVAIGAHSYRSVESILTHRLDQRPSEQIELALPIEHSNIRGARYYH